MHPLIAGELARSRADVLLGEAARWRRSARASAHTSQVLAASTEAGDPEGDRWRIWRFIEPDPGFYGRPG